MKQTSVNVPARSIGLDLSDETSTFCMVDGDGKVAREGSVQTGEAGLRRLFEGLDASRVVLEATTQSSWIAKLIRSFGHEAIVINPRRLQLISESVSKTDRNDARLLARVGRLDLGMLQPVHEKSDQSQSIRVQMRARTQLVRTRTKLINLVRSSMKLFGATPPSCSPDCFHKRAGLPALLRPALEPVLKLLGTLQREIESYDEAVAGHCEKQFPQTGVFREIHGVGPVLALSFMTAIEQPKRFKSSRTVGAYLGLTPKTYQSGKSDPRLRISKQGDGVLRSLLVTAATHILRRSAPDSDLKRYGKRIARSGTKRDKARARIAVARKLAVLMHRLWLTGEAYDPLRSTQAV
jgi:transposase